MGYRYQQGDRPLQGYTIQRGVGRGGFGEVYYATSDGGKEVAIKHLRDNPQVELRGVQHVLNLKSPYLIGVHDVRQNADGEFFIIMEYVNGPSLRDLMNDAPDGLGPQKAAYFAREIAKGLAYLHDRGIVHRDVKPGNIFYEDGYVKIGDYGLSKFMASSQHSGQTVSVGTVHYMAPEVGSGNYDRTIDVYALGVMLYEMLLGRVPFGGSSMGEVLMKHLTAQPEVDELQPPFPHVIRRALAKDPKDRYQTVDELVHDLFEEEDLSKSVAAFEPTSLSARAARAGADVRAERAAAVHAFGTGSSNIGHQHSPPVLNAPPPPPPPPRIQRAAGMAMPIHGEAPALSGPPALQFVPKLLQCAIITLGMSVAFGAVNGDYRLIAPTFLLTLITALGVFGAEWIARFRTESRGNWWPKLIVAVLIAIPIGGALRRSFDVLDQLEPMGIGLTIIAISWRSLIRDGKSGNRSLRRVFTAGLIGFALGYPFAHGDMQLGLAIIAATAALCVQTLGQLWPVEISEAEINGVATTDSDMRHSDDRGFAGNETLPAHAGRFPMQHGGVDGAYDRGHVRGGAPSEPVRARRSTAVRIAWLFAACISLGGMLFLFIAPNAMRGFHGDKWSIAITSGVVMASVFLFCLSCAIPAFHAGLWRGVFRKAVFFGSIAICSGCGTAIGLFDLKDEPFGINLAAIIAGGIAIIGVWFIPVAAYEPRKQTRKDDAEDNPKRQKARRMQAAGAGLLVACAGLTAILLITIPDHDWDDVVAPICVPIGLIGVGVLAGGIVMGARASRTSTPKLELPLRREFEVGDISDVGNILQRFGAMHGYRLTESADMFWSFQRGAWGGQFFNSDVRKWKTRMNFAAFPDSAAGFTLRCMLDVDAEINAPGKKHLRRLNDELDELERLLVNSGSRVGVERDGEVRV